MQAHVFILQLKQHELRHYVIWTPGWKKWIPVKEMLKADQKFFVIPPPVNQTENDDTKITTKLAELTQSLSNKSNSSSGRSNSGLRGERTYTEIGLGADQPATNDEFAPDNVNWEKTPVVPVLKKNSEGDSQSDDDRRTYKRFPHRIEIVLMTNKGKSFRSSSLNVSVGGALLSEAVPATLIKDVMDVLIINPFPDDKTPSHLLIKGRVVSDTRDRRRLMFYDVSPDVQAKLKSILERYQENYKVHKKKKAS